MREALAAIRTDLGADAVMLSSRKLGKGVEVIAAIDYDDSLLGAVGVAPPAARMQDRTGRDFGYAADDEADARADADPRGRAAGSTDEPTDNPTERPAEARGREQLIAARVAAAREAALEEAAARAAAAAAHARPARPTAVRPVTQEPAVRAAPAGAAASPDQPGVAQEIKDLRRLLETQLASLAWNDLNRQAPIRARTLRELTKLGVDSTLAVELADEIPAEAGSQEALRLIVRRFGERLPLAQGDLTDRGGLRAAAQRRRAGAREHRHLSDRRAPAAVQLRADPARTARGRRERGRSAPRARRVLEEEARADRHGRHEPTRRAARESIHDAQARRPSHSDAAHALGRRRPGVPRRGAARVRGRLAGGADRHEARRGSGARRDPVARDPPRAADRLSLRRPARARGPASRFAEAFLAHAQRDQAHARPGVGAGRERARGALRSGGARGQCVTLRSIKPRGCAA